jgi:hypothetical protein
VEQISGRAAVRPCGSDLIRPAISKKTGTEITGRKRRLIRKNGIQSGCVQMVGKHEAMAVLQSSNDVL